MMRLLWIYLLTISIQIQTPLAISEKTYVIDGQDRVSWAEALKLCHQRDMELVSVDSAKEDEHLRQILGPVVSASTGGAKDFWTSGKLNEGNEWMWMSTGQPVTYTNWVAGAPNDYLGNEKCLRLWGLHQFRWDDFFCRAKLHFVCQKRATIHEDPLRRSSNPRPQPQDLSYGEDPQDSDFESAHVVTVKGLPAAEDLYGPLVAPKKTFRRTTTVILPEVHRGPVPMKNLVLQLKGYSLTFFTQAALGWEDAKDECNRCQMELAIIDDSGKRIQEFLLMNVHVFLDTGCKNKEYRTYVQINWMTDRGRLDQRSYWIGYLHTKQGGQRSRAKRAFQQWQEQPSVQLSIGVKPGAGSVVARVPTDHQCPLLQTMNGMHMTFEACQTKNYFICEKAGPDLIGPNLI